MAIRCDRYVIVELDGSGHRFWYVSLLIQWLSRNVDRSQTYLVTTRAAMNRPEWDEFIEGNLAAGSVDIVLVDGPDMTFKAIAALLRPRGSRLVIPDGDRWLARLTMETMIHRLSPRGTMLIMRPYQGPGIRGAVRYFIKLALIDSMTVLARNFTVLRLAPPGGPICDRRWVNDPIEFHPRNVARAEWYAIHGLTLDRRYLVVLGDLSRRKFVSELVEAFDGRSVGNWHLVLVGRLGAQERSYFDSRSALTRISLVEGFIEDEDFDTWVAQADAVAVLLRNEGASGVLGKCAVAGVPILVGGARSVLDSARLLDLPRSEIESVDVKSICDALISLPHRGTVRSQSPITAGSEDFASQLMCD